MSSLISLIKSDAFRYCGSSSFKSCFVIYLRVCGFRYMFWHRIAHKCKHKNKFIYFLPWLILNRLKYRYGFDIPAETIIHSGFYIGHFGGIVISGKVLIGSNCNISQGVTIGFNSRGKRKGYPSVGEGVYIGPGAKIIGNIRIGNNVAIGANAVVLDDVPDNAVVIGIPARIVSMKGAQGYILNSVINIT